MGPSPIGTAKLARSAEERARHASLTVDGRRRRTRPRGECSERYVSGVQDPAGHGDHASEHHTATQSPTLRNPTSDRRRALTTARVRQGSIRAPQSHVTITMPVGKGKGPTR
jgi:hypothetical protein